MKKALFLALALLIMGCSQEKKENQTAVVSEHATKPVAQAPVTKVEKPVEKKVEKTVTKKVLQSKPKPQKVAVATTKGIDGAKIFVKCAGCHGKNAEKKALGKSHVIKGWAQAKIVNAVKGYKAGTYGGAMKGVMKGQVANLSDAEVNAVAKYISNL